MKKYKIVPVVLIEDGKAVNEWWFYQKQFLFFWKFKVKTKSRERAIYACNWAGIEFVEGYVK